MTSGPRAEGIWRCAECGKAHPRRRSLHLAARQPRSMNMRPIQLCSLECFDTLRVRNGLVDELTLPVFHRKHGHVVRVHSGRLKVIFNVIEKWRRMNPDASLEQHLRDPHVDCPFCQADKGRTVVLAGCALCWQSRHVPVAVAVEFNLMGLKPYEPWMESSSRRKEEWQQIKQKLRALRKRHGLKTEKWK